MHTYKTFLEFGTRCGLSNPATPSLVVPGENSLAIMDKRHSGNHLLTSTAVVVAAIVSKTKMWFHCDFYVLTKDSTTNDKNLHFIGRQASAHYRLDGLFAILRGKMAGLKNRL